MLRQLSMRGQKLNDPKRNPCMLSLPKHHRLTAHALRLLNASSLEPRACLLTPDCEKSYRAFCGFLLVRARNTNPQPNAAPRPFARRIFSEQLLKTFRSRPRIPEDRCR